MIIHFPLKAFFVCFSFSFSFNAVTLPCSFSQEIDLSSVASHSVTQISWKEPFYQPLLSSA